MPTHRIFRYSRWDLLLVAVIPFQVLFFFGLANEYSSLSWPVLLALVPACFAVSLQNTGASHNHSHTPLFRVRWLNTLTTMGFSFNGSPKTPFHIGHGVHHRMPEPWSERSLLALCGLKRPVHHQLLGFGSFYFESLGSRYLVLLWLLKRWPIERVAHFAAPDDPQAARCLLEPLLDPDTLRATKLDLAAWILFRIGLCVISWKFFLFYFVPVSYLVQTIRYGDNFFQHWGATDPDDPTRDSVSCSVDSVTPLTSTP